MDVAIAISLIALLVSFLSFYRSYWYKRIDLIGYLIFLSLDFEEEMYNFDCSLSNNGNKDILVTGVDLVSKQKATPVINFEGHVPLVLKPGEIRLIPIKINNYFINNCKASNENFTIRIDTISSNGEFFIAEKQVDTSQDFLGDVLAEKFIFKQGRA